MLGIGVKQHGIAGPPGYVVFPLIPQYSLERHPFKRRYHRIIGQGLAVSHVYAVQCSCAEPLLYVRSAIRTVDNPDGNVQLLRQPRRKDKRIRRIGNVSGIRAVLPHRLCFKIRLFGIGHRRRYFCQPNIPVTGGGFDLFLLLGIAGAYSHLHVGLSGAKPNVPYQDIGYSGGGVVGFHRQRTAGSVRVHCLQINAPRSLYDLRRFDLSFKFDCDRRGAAAASPDFHPLIPLQHHVVGKDMRQTDGRRAGDFFTKLCCLARGGSRRRALVQNGGGLSGTALQKKEARGKQCRSCLPSRFSTHNLSLICRPHSAAWRSGHACRSRTHNDPAIPSAYRSHIFRHPHRWRKDWQTFCGAAL